MQTVRESADAGDRDRQQRILREREALCRASGGVVGIPADTRIAVVWNYGIVPVVSTREVNANERPIIAWRSETVSISRLLCQRIQQTKVLGLCGHRCHRQPATGLLYEF